MAELFEGDYDSLPMRIRDIFDTCSPEEQAYLVDILRELSMTGSSTTYDNLFLQDYKEIPVDIDTFLCSDEYLGFANDGGDSIYPYWKKGFHTIFDNPLQYTQIIFTGATRIGKSSTAVTGVAYMLYRLMCFRNPQKFFKKKEISKFYFLFFNITLDLAKTVGFREFNDLLKSSPWFNKHGRFSKSEKNFYYIPEGDMIEIVPGSGFSHALGMQVFCAFIDEMNFAKAGIKDINKAKKNVKESYDAIMARIEGTFRLDGVVWGKLFAVSSKKTDQDFLEDHIQKQMAAGNKQLLVFDAPQWEILPEGTFSSERFWLAVGDRHRKGFVVQDESEEALQELRDQGYQLLQVPLDMKTNFLADFDVALRDLAGISVPGSMSFITQEVIDKCIGTRRNPFFQDILEIGTRDAYAIEDFFHWEFLTPEILKAEWFIHIDLSLNDDKTGIGASCITGRKEILQDDKNTLSLPYFTHIFNISIKSPAGDKIPYAKITNFICWLRQKGAHIEKVTRDQYQSEYLAQLLEGQGFDVEKVSLDRTPDGYLTLRSVLMEERVDMLQIDLLESELIQLRRDGFSGVPDHPVGGCFVGNTLIHLCDNTDVPIDLLVDDIVRTKLFTGHVSKYYHKVYTINELTQEVEIQPIVSGYLTKYVTETVIVFLSNHESFECTPDHLIMLEDGDYKSAETLKYGDRLKYVKDSVIVLSVAIRQYQEPIPVYDLCVKGNHNFPLSAGVFVHNSKDSADGFAGSIWAASKYSPGIPLDRQIIGSAIKNANRPRNSEGPSIPGIVNPYKRYRKV